MDHCPGQTASEEVRRASEDRSAIAEGNLAVLVKRWRGARRDAGADWYPGKMTRARNVKELRL